MLHLGPLCPHTTPRNRTIKPPMDPADSKAERDMFLDVLAELWSMWQLASDLESRQAAHVQAHWEVIAVRPWKRRWLPKWARHFVDSSPLPFPPIPPDPQPASPQFGPDPQLASHQPVPSVPRPACCSPCSPDTTLDPRLQFEGTRLAVFCGGRGGHRRRRGHHGSRQFAPLSLDPQPVSPQPGPVPQPASAASPQPGPVPQPASAASPQPVPWPASAASPQLLPDPQQVRPQLDPDPQPASAASLQPGPPDPLPLRATGPRVLLADGPASAPPVVRPTPAPRVLLADGPASAPPVVRPTPAPRVLLADGPASAPPVHKWNSK
ncbi:vegetative cell wall protein gp1-like [Micropterus salmoides]|uniref:vegetative cell wall protein gp1-like n=1 Tax=Micropterus salmoides TaxID=27706 RepID=UPI0018ECDFB4|nr:vegetative cell wall protein gp1-like [Micropterus salmoides]